MDKFSNYISLKDIEKKALEILPLSIRDYYTSGADDEETLKENLKSFKNFILRPFVLRNVSNLDNSVKIILNNKKVIKEFKFPYPIGIAPTAFQRMAHNEGEIATIKAANEMFIPMICSTLSTTPLEEVAKNANINTTIWFQLYVYKNRLLTERLVRRAEKAGFSALVLTVDSPHFGRRRADERNEFKLPEHLRIANFEKESTFSDNVGASGLTKYIISNFDQTLNWEDLRWLVNFSTLPIIVKGIMRADDALLAIESGVAAIIVSNHGGRQLDHCMSTIDALPEIIEVVNDKIPVFVDGGFRSGTDIFKALAIGAKIIFIGRPIIYGLAIGGKEGVKHVLKILKTELDYAMRLSGCSSISELRSHKDIVINRNRYFSKL
ncbi:FMN hydroxy acid dehydrogenase domain-containing protein [Meloidogyne graminicola]|uniref:(S)-2-hydroxy-acid oxidase n=1 Tax=Meloidogyne graminicola TaxID=189291 RepID=A0A8S9ZE40_9BILA|nr:FMN hydroxy acid dehydrogenase domain-containing protein [Meloidogyne graminicola]